MSTADTLLYCWKGRIRARVGIASLQAGDLGTQSIDTSTATADSTIPWNDTVSFGTLVDDRDGQIYRTVTIGTQPWAPEHVNVRQTWMAENLNFKVDSSWCYADRADSCVKYGRLYSWTAALELDTSFNIRLWSKTIRMRGICPSGWHVPATWEWAALLDNVQHVLLTGLRLKSKGGWKLDGVSGDGTDSLGFRVLPAGMRYPDGTYHGAGVSSNLWSSSEDVESLAWASNAYAGSNTMGARGSQLKSSGLSLRCVKDSL